MELKSILRNETSVCVYADDIALQCTGRNTSNMVASLNQDLKDLKKWLMYLNLNSTRTRQRLPSTQPVSISNTNLISVSIMWYLKKKSTQYILETFSIQNYDLVLISQF